MTPTWKLWTLTAAILLALPASAAAQRCVPATNIEAIVDDSGSMSFNDANDLRIRAMELFIDTPGNERRTLGAVEFGSDASPLFAPGVIGGNSDTMKASLNASLIEDNGGTDYNDAFTAAGAQNPNAAARIFLTDGAHTDEPAYADGHRGGPPTHVIGLGVIEGSEFDLLLQRIANETGGLYRRATDATALQAAMFDINTAIACQAPPVRFTNAFSRVGQTVTRTVRIPTGVRSATFALTWANAGDAFTIRSFRVIRRGDVVARGAKVRKLRVTRRTGATFMTVRVKRLVKGKLRFKLRATRLAAPGATVNLTTQVSRTRRR
jgi:von Willebrand factor type A domain